jgi:acetyl esterase
MRTISFFGILALVVLLSSTTAQEQRPRTRKNRAARPAGAKPTQSPQKSLVFKKTLQGDLKVHFYFPPDWKSKDRRPAIVFWFGGGFVGGSPAQFYTKAEYFAGRGLVCALAEYRVKNTHGTSLDKCVEDARSAMRWMKQHAEEYGVDPQKVIASGGSAGGTLSILVALATGPDAEDDPDDVSPKPCAMVLFNPAQGEAVISRIDPKLCDKPRLIEQIAGLDRPEQGQPPAIVFFGTDDRLLIPSQKFCRKASELGNRCELWTAQNQGHGFFNRSPWHEATLFKADQFLGSLGYLQGHPTIKYSTEAVLRQRLSEE